MEEIRSFLSNSTIHGLYYISTARKFPRLFWIVVVTAGFVGASLMIVGSFRGWAESPVDTSVEIVDITDVKFPTVTVCPPSNTMTLLNYPLTVNISQFDEKFRMELIYTVDQIISEDARRSFNRLKDHFEVNTFRNWFLGKSRISVEHLNSDNQKVYKVITAAEAGFIMTPFFGESSKEATIENVVFYEVEILPTYDNYRYNSVTKNFSLEVKVDHNINGTLLNGRLVEEHYHGSFKPRHNSRWNLTSNVSFSTNDLSNLKRIPGFRIEWKYNGSTPSGRNFSEENSNFIKLAKIVQKSNSSAAVWKDVREARFQWVKNVGPKAYTLCHENMMPGKYIALDALINYIERNQGLNIGVDSVAEISEDVLEMAAEMYIYLLYCSSDNDFKLVRWNLFYIDLIENYSPKSIINTLVGIINIAKHDVGSVEYVLAMTVLENIKPFFSLALLTEPLIHIKRNKLLDKKYETLAHCFLDNPGDSDCDFLRTFGDYSISYQYTNVFENDIFF